MSDSSLTKPTKRFRHLKKWFQTAAAITAIAATLWTAHSLWVNRLLNQAREALARFDRREAAALAEQAANWGADAQAALLIRAEALKFLDPAAAAELYQQLLARARNTTDENDLILHYIEAAQFAREIENARASLDAIARRTPADARFLVLEARQLALEGDLRQAFETAQAALELAPDSPAANLIKGELLLFSRDVQARIGAKVALLKASDGPTSFALQALNSLVKRGDDLLFEDDRRLIAERLEQHPESGPAGKLLAASVRLHDNPEEKQRIVDDAVTRYKASHPRLLAAWLLQVDEPEIARSVVEDLGSELDELDPGLFRLKLQSVALSRDLDQLRHLIENDDGQLDDLTQATMLAVLSDPTQDIVASRKLWDEAFEFAQKEKSSVRLLVLARDAARKLWIQRASQAYLELWETPAAQGRYDALATEIVAMLIRGGDFDTAYDFLRNNRDRLRPVNPVLNDLAYLMLLKGQDLEEALTLITTLHDAAPDNRSVISTNALAHTLNGDLKTARSLANRLSDKERQRPGIRLMLATLTSAEGDDVAAKELIDSINPEQLAPPERRFFLEHFQVSP